MASAQLGWPLPKTECLTVPFATNAFLNLVFLSTNIMRTHTLLIILIAAATVISGCRKKGCTDPQAQNYSEDAKKDDGSCEYSYTVPTVYNFDNVSYTGQTTRMDMLAELTTLMKAANTPGTNLVPAALKGMYAGTGNYFSSADLNSSTKNLQSKTFAADTSMFINWIDSLAAASLSDTTGSAGIAGAVTSTAGDKRYLLSAKGVEYTQLIEKGLMGACLYYQVAEVYTRPDKIGDAVDNTTVVAGEGTDMEHHWDEAFGYFGVGVDFPTSAAEPRFIGKYCNDRDAVLGVNAEVMNAYLKGRAAISNADGPVRDVAAAEVRVGLERVFAGTAIHYLNGANTDFADDALRCHQLSEAYAFIAALKYNSDRVASSAEITTMLNDLGPDFYAISSATIIAVRDQLATIYSMENVKNSL